MNLFSLQPLLFRYMNSFWVKLDHTAAAISSACIADAFESLLQTFFVMNVQYPQELWLVYGFLEKVMGLKTTVLKSVRLADFCQQVLNK